MFSVPVVFTAVVSGIGFILNLSMMILVLSRGKKLYHYLFATVLFVCANWDMGILLSMVRNNHESELVIYGYVVFLPCAFLYALIYHFTCAYLEQPRKKFTLIIWVFSILSIIVLVTGWGGKIDGVFNYSWGNIYRIDQRLQIMSLFILPIGWYVTGSSSWRFYSAAKRETSPTKRRHMNYMAISFLALTFATVKLAVLYNVDNPILLPAGMLVNDLFSALIAVAIIKHQLFDITIILQKGTIFSALTGLVVFVFAVSEHLIGTYLGEMLSEHSHLPHIISTAIVIAVLLPLKTRIEHRVEVFFKQKSVQF
jgi:hypothetical protein